MPAYKLLSSCSKHMLKSINKETNPYALDWYKTVWNCKNVLGKLSGLWVLLLAII